MKGRKSVSTILAIAVCMSMGACTKDKKNEKKKVAIWLNSGHSKQFWEHKIEQYNSEIGKENGVVIELESKTDANYGQMLQVAQQSDQLPDFFFSSDCVTYIESDQIVPLSDLPGVDELIDKYADYMITGVHKLDGKVYSIPFGLTTRGLIYNKEMFVKKGLVDENGEAKPPRTFDEVREYAKLLTDNSKREYGIALPVKWTSFYESEVHTLTYSTAGHGVYDPQNGVFDCTVLKPALEMICGIKEDKSYYPGAEGLDNDPARARFAEGNIGMKLGYSFDVGVFSDQFRTKMEWGVAPLPVADTENCYKQFAYVGNGVMLSKRGLEKIGAETASQIINFMYGDETIKELYEKGLEIPCVWDVVKDVELGNDAKPGWKEFCELAAISVPEGRRMNTDIGNEKDLSAVVVEEIWPNGDAGLDDILNKYTKIYNDGAAEYQKKHPEYDPNTVIDKEWDNKVRRQKF